jgi:hypothetical protein
MLFRCRHAGRALALFIASLMFSGRLLALAHLGAVVHQACAEHGELVEVGHRPTTLVLATERTGTELRTQPVSAQHAHEHCAIAGHTRMSPVLGTTPTVADAAAVVSFALPCADALPGARMALFRLAPKNSPPA